MFPDQHLPNNAKRSLHPDRRPLPKANEIRLRVKRFQSKREA